MLTKKQCELLMFIHERVKETGVPPSFEEMKDALGLRSKSGIHRLITALEERGFIRRLPYRARALEILKLPDSVPVSMAANRGVTGFKPSVIEGSLGKSSAATTTDSVVPEVAAAAAPHDMLSVPVMGRIAAGVPIEAVQNHSHDIALSSEMLRAGKEHFALEVQGDSMINAGILEGDIVVLERSDTAQSGEIVVALIDEEEATLKRLRRRGDSIALEAANPAYETRIFGPDRVRVQGKLVGLVRQY